MKNAHLGVIVGNTLAVNCENLGQRILQKQRGCIKIPIRPLFLISSRKGLHRMKQSLDFPKPRNKASTFPSQGFALSQKFCIFMT